MIYDPFPFKKNFQSIWYAPAGLEVMNFDRNLFLGLLDYKLLEAIHEMKYLSVNYSSNA